MCAGVLVCRCACVLVCAMNACAVCVLQVPHVVQQSANHPNEDVSGSLVLTASHLIFQEPSGRRETWVGPSP